MDWVSVFQLVIGLQIAAEKVSKSEFRTMLHCVTFSQYHEIHSLLSAKPFKIKSGKRWNGWDEYWCFIFAKFNAIDIHSGLINLMHYFRLCRSFFELIGLAASLLIFMNFDWITNTTNAQMSTHKRPKIITWHSVPLMWNANRETSIVSGHYEYT